MSNSKWDRFNGRLFRIQFSQLEELEDDTPFVVSDEQGGQHIISTHGEDSSNYKYNFKSMGFTENLSKVIQSEKISHVRPTPILSVKGTDQVQVRASKHEKFTPITNTSVNVYSFEKSLFQAISRDMLNFISGVKSFNNLIGEPVNKYRKNYKLLEYLRERYFRNVLSDIDFERYLNYYKWTDSAIGVLLNQMVPASAFSNYGIENVIESHALERNKYEHKYSRFERKIPDLDANILAINELLYDWEHGHFSDDENEHCLWQKDRKERTEPELENIRKVLTTKTVSKKAGPGKDYVVRNLVKPYKYSTDKQLVLSIGHNRQANKIKDLYKIIYSGKEITINTDDFYESKRCDDILNPQNKIMYTAKTNTSDTDGYLDADADLILPFSFYKSTAGVNFPVFKSDLVITNNLEMPESISTTAFRSGPPHRTVKIGTPAGERPEAYEIVADEQTMTIRKPTSGPISMFSRSLLGNRFYQIQNIKTKISDTGVITSGNYYKDYEIVMTNGRLQNNNYLVESEGGTLLDAQVESFRLVPGMFDFAVPERPKRDHVIVNRFSAIGSPETSGKYSLDRVSEEYSVYNTVNYRNSLTRGIYNMLSKERSEQFGFRDELAVTGSIHKTNRNFNRYVTLDSEGAEVFGTTADNYFVTHQIPQHDFGYSWITASADHDVHDFLDRNGNIGHQHNFEIEGDLKSSETISFVEFSQHADNIDFANLSLHALTGIKLFNESVFFRGSGANVPAPQVKIIDEDENIFTNQNDFLNSSILNRQGPYGWPTWKQIRGAEHPITKFHRKNNIISAVFRGNTPFASSHRGSEFEYKNTKENSLVITKQRTIKNYEEILATSKFNPITVTRHTYRTESGIEFLYEGIPLPAQVPQWALGLMWWNDEFIHEFITKTESISNVLQLPSVSMRVPLQNTVTGFANQDMADDFYYKEKSVLSSKNIDLINDFIRTESMNIDASFLEINYIETVYPREINTFTKEARDRELYKFFGWNSDRENRRLKLDENIQYGEFLSTFMDSSENVIPIFRLESPIVKEEDFEKSYFNTYEIIDMRAGSKTNLETSTWVLDARRDFSALPTIIPPTSVSLQSVVVGTNDEDDEDTLLRPGDEGWENYISSFGGSIQYRSKLGTGILQNEYSTYAMGGNLTRGLPPFAPTYNRRVPQQTDIVAPVSTTILDGEGQVVYDLEEGTKLTASDPAEFYVPFRKDGSSEDDFSFPQDEEGNNLRFQLADAIRTSTTELPAKAYLHLGSSDMFDPQRELGPERQHGQTGECEGSAAANWNPGPIGAGGFPAENSTGSSPLSIEIPDNDGIFADELDDDDKLFLSFTELRLNANEPEDWNITSTNGIWNSTPPFLPAGEPTWIFDGTGRIETRKYRDGFGWLYKFNPVTEQGFKILAKYEIPLLIMEIDWDKIIANAIPGVDNKNFITAKAQLKLIDGTDITQKQVATPSNDGSEEFFANVTFQSSDEPKVPGVKRQNTQNDPNNPCPEDPAPFSEYSIETADGAVNQLILSSPLTTVDVPGFVLAGEAKWEAADGTEVGPFYDEYKHFAEETRLVGQQYSLVSEFTISRYIEDIYGADQPGASVVGDDFLQLPGVVHHQSSGEISIGSQFFKTYSNSDFLKYFQPVKKNITENGFDLTTGKITMHCSAVKRLLPYRGFYPAERAVQISEIFHRNYLREDTFQTEYHKNEFLTEDQAHESLKIKIGNLKTQVSKPLFGPGVLFNSIKSGLAVDYPLFSSNIGEIKRNLIENRVDFWQSPTEILKDQDLENPVEGSILDFGDIPFISPIFPESIESALLERGSFGMPRISGDVHRRVEFEDLLEPIRLFGQTIYENEPNPAASLLYGNRSIYMVKEDEPRFGVIDTQAALENNTIIVRQNVQSSLNSLRPYTSAIHNYTSETVKFFLQDEKLQTAVSKPVKPLLTQGVNYKMRIYINNKDTVMYDRHSAFGPPVDDNSPQMKRFISSNIEAEPSQATISFEDVTTSELADQTITITDALGNIKTFIYRQEVTPVTASASISFVSVPSPIFGDATEFAPPREGTNFLYDIDDCGEFNPPNGEIDNEGFTENIDYISPIDSGAAFISDTTSPMHFENTSTTIPGESADIEIFYYNSQCYTDAGSVVQIEINDPTNWSTTVHSALEMNGATDTTPTDHPDFPSRTWAAPIFFTEDENGNATAHFTPGLEFFIGLESGINSHIENINSQAEIDYTIFPSIQVTFYDSKTSDPAFILACKQVLTEWNQNNNDSQWDHADALMWIPPSEHHSQDFISAVYNTAVLPSGMPMIDVRDPVDTSIFKTKQALANQLVQLIAESRLKTWNQVDLSQNPSYANVQNQSDLTSVRGGFMTAGIDNAKDPGKVGIFSMLPHYLWPSNRIHFSEDYFSTWVAGLFGAPLPAADSIEVTFTTGAITDFFGKVSTQDASTAAGAFQISLMASNNGSEVDSVITAEETNSTADVATGASNTHKRYIDLALTPGYTGNITADGQTYSNTDTSLSCKTAKVINDLAATNGAKLTLIASCAQPSTNVDVADNNPFDILTIERTDTGNKVDVIVDNNFTTQSWVQSMSDSFSGGVDGKSFTNAGIDSEFGHTIIKMPAVGTVEDVLVPTRENAVLAIGDEDNGFNADAPDGMIVEDITTVEVIGNNEIPHPKIQLTQGTPGTAGDVPIGQSDGNPQAIVGFEGGVDFSEEPYLKEEIFTNFDAHGYLPYVPPYLDPETAPYVQLVFTPPETRQYTIPEIIDGVEATYFNMPAPNDSEDNTNFTHAMNVGASINYNNSVSLYTDNYAHLGSNSGTQTLVGNPDPTLYRWVIQPKWETPIMDFKDVEVSTLNLDTMEVEKTTGSVWKTRYQTDYYTELPGSEVQFLTASTGMWHQRGKPTVENGNKGYFMTIVGPGQKTGTKTTTGDLALEVGFTEGMFNSDTPVTFTGEDADAATGTTAVVFGLNATTTVRQIPEEANPFQSLELGRVAEEKIISEAVVAIPYYLTDDCDIVFFEMRDDVYSAAIQRNNQARDEYVEHMRRSRSVQELNNIKQEYELFYESVGLEAVDSAAYQMRMMDKYIMPPQFDFNRNTSLEPFVSYIFQFKAKLTRQDLADIWQNLYPTSKQGISVAQHSKVAEIGQSELFTDVEYVTHMIGNSTAPYLKGKASIYKNPEKFLENDVRWLVFKIKYRAESHYTNVIENSITEFPENIIEKTGINVFNKNTEFYSDNDKSLFKDYGYNWPYDYFSMIELVKLEAKVDFLSAVQRAQKPAATGGTLNTNPMGNIGLAPSENFQTEENIQNQFINTAVLNKIVSRQTLKDVTDPLPINPSTVVIPISSGDTIKPSSESVFLNGQLLVSGQDADYTISGNTITLSQQLDVNDSVQISYIKE